MRACEGGRRGGREYWQVEEDTRRIDVREGLRDRD